MGQKVSGLANEMLASEVASDDLIYIVDVSEPTSSNSRSNKMEWAELKLGITSLYDIDESNSLRFNWLEDDTADRILNLKVNGANRELDLQNDVALNQSLLTTSSVIFVDIELGGELEHKGTTLGFYGTTPLLQQASPADASAEVNPDATDLATVITLANSLKAKHNELAGKNNDLKDGVVNTGLLS